MEIKTVWDKFLTYDTEYAINEYKAHIGVNLNGGVGAWSEIIDPIPASQRGLYFNGYSAVMTFNFLNLGTEFNFGYWVKPFYFEGLFTVFGLD